MGTKLFVGGLSWDTTDASLRAAFERFGEVAEARVILDRETGRSRGFGFVTFADPSSTPEAMRAMDGAQLDGRSIRVNEAQERGGGGGGGGGGPRPPRGRDDRGGGGGRPGGGPRTGPPGRGAPPPVVTRGRGGPPRGDGEFTPRPGGGGGRPPGGGGGGYSRGGDSPGGPGFRPPPAQTEDSAGWGEDRQRTSDRKRRTKKKTDGPAKEGEDFDRRGGEQRKGRRDSGRSWRDYTIEDEDEDLY